jgi:hypothetical protein
MEERTMFMDVMTWYQEDINPLPKLSSNYDKKSLNRDFPGT